MLGVRESFLEWRTPKCHRGLQGARHPGGDGVKAPAKAGARGGCRRAKPGSKVLGWGQEGKWEKGRGGSTEAGGGSPRPGAIYKLSEPASAEGEGFPGPARVAAQCLWLTAPETVRRVGEWSCRKCLRAARELSCSGRGPGPPPPPCSRRRCAAMTTP